MEAYLRVGDSVCECVSALLMQWTDFSMDKGVRQQWVGDKDTGQGRAGQGRVLCNVCVCAWRQCGVRSE